jgi:hypothetical protein
MSILRFRWYLSIREKRPGEPDACVLFRTDAALKPKSHLTKRKAASYLAKGQGGFGFSAHSGLILSR